MTEDEIAKEKNLEMLYKYIFYITTNKTNWRTHDDIMEYIETHEFLEEYIKAQKNK